MSLPPSDNDKAKNQIVPWLHLGAALLVIVLNALFSAVHSPLGQEISAGESPGFAWIRANINTCMGLGLVFLLLACGIQLRQLRQSSFKNNRLPPFLIYLEVFSIAAIALLLFSKQTGLLAPVYAILMLSILSQGVIAFRRPGLAGLDHQAVELQKPAANVYLFFILLFIFGAAISLLEPSRYRIEGQIVLDSNFESLLGYVFPSILSGFTGLWLGIGMLGIILVISRLFFRLHRNKDIWIIYFLIFFSLVAFFMGFLLITLYYAISWQINNLHLKLTVWQLYIFLSVSGGILFSSVFFRIVPHIPHPPKGQPDGYRITDLRGSHPFSDNMAFDIATKHQDMLGDALDFHPWRMWFHRLCGFIRQSV